MQCKNPFDETFIHSKFPRTFYAGPLKRKREQILLDRSMADLPVVQVAMEERDEYVRERTTHYTEMGAQMRLAIINVREARVALDMLRDNMNQIRWEIQNPGKLRVNKMAAERVSLPCPQEDCRGFLNQRGRCGICKAVVCRQCHQTVDQTEGAVEHQCNADDVKSVARIQRDTKPCPKCGTRIFKIAGCDHFFCTAPDCKVSFSWLSGRIMDDVENTSPHYYAWMRENGGMPRNPRDGCGNAARLPPMRCGLGGYLYHQNRLVRHARAIDNQMPEEPDHSELLERYLMRNVDRHYVGVRLQRLEKAYNKEMHIYNFNRLFAEEGVGIFNRMAEKQYQDVRDDINQLLELVRYINNSYDVLRKTYQNAFPSLQKLNVDVRVWVRTTPGVLNLVDAIFVFASGDATE